MQDTEYTNMYKVFCGFQGVFTYNKEKNVYINEFDVEITETDLLNL